MKSPKTETCICIRSEEFGMTHVSVPELLSSIKGPWALIFWQASDLYIIIFGVFALLGLDL